MAAAADSNSSKTGTDAAPPACIVCSICLEPVQDAPPHCMCATRCGHIFGRRSAQLPTLRLHSVAPQEGKGDGDVPHLRAHVCVCV